MIYTIYIGALLYEDGRGVIQDSTIINSTYAICNTFGYEHGETSVTIGVNDTTGIVSNTTYEDDIRVYIDCTGEDVDYPTYLGDEE